MYEFTSNDLIYSSWSDYSITWGDSGPSNVGQSWSQTELLKGRTNEEGKGVEGQIREGKVVCMSFFFYNVMVRVVIEVICINSGVHQDTLPSRSPTSLNTTHLFPHLLTLTG